MVFVSLESASNGKRPKRRTYRTEDETSARLSDEVERHTHRFTSVAAALFAPLLVLLSIPGLTEHWYIQKDSNGTTQQTRPDPRWVLACGGIALATVILANCLLLLRIVDTHPRFFSISALVFLVVHVLVNVPSLVVFAIKHAEPDGYTLSTAFSLTAASTALAGAVIILLSIDAFSTKGFKERGTGLSPRQRSLVLTFSAFVSYICVSSVIFKYQIGLSFIDALYFAVQTFLTVGFGTPVPATQAAQGVVILLATGGIVAFAVCVAHVRLTALESLQRQYKRQERNIVARLRRNKDHGRASTDDGDSTEASAEDGDEKNKDTCLKEEELEDAVVELSKQRNLDFRAELFTSFAVLAIIWLVAAGVYMKLEGWTFFIAFYFSFVSFSTIGYGDISPQTNGGRSFFVVISLIGSGVITTFFSVLADSYSDRFKQTHQRSVISRMITAVYPDKQLERQIVEDEEAARRGVAGTDEQTIAEPEEEDPKSTAKEDRVEGRKDTALAEALLLLLKDTRGHLDQLVRTDGGQGEVVNHLVEDVMSDQHFDQKIRAKVLNDEGLRRFLYLRRLQAKLVRLEDLASAAMAENDAGNGTSRSKAASAMKLEVEKDRVQLAEAVEQPRRSS